METWLLYTQRIETRHRPIQHHHRRPPATFTLPNYCVTDDDRRHIVPKTRPSGWPKTLKHVFGLKNTNRLKRLTEKKTGTSDAQVGLSTVYRVRQKKSGPLNFFAVFSATVWDFNMKFCSFIY